MITEIENRLLEIPEINYVNRRVNPLFTGTSKLPAVSVEYAYSADGGESVSQYRDAIVLSLSSIANDEWTDVGSADIDAHLALDTLICKKLDRFYFTNDVDRNVWRIRIGGNVSRESGFCQSQIRFERARSVRNC